MIRRFINWLTGSETKKRDDTPSPRKPSFDPYSEASMKVIRDHIARNNERRPRATPTTSRPSYPRRSESPRRQDDNSSADLMNPLNPWSPLSPLSPFNHSTNSDTTPSSHSSHSSHDTGSCHSSSDYSGGGSSYDSGSSSCDSGGGGGDSGGGGGDCTANPYADASFNRLNRRLQRLAIA